jgi:hypothetical protein
MHQADEGKALGTGRELRAVDSRDWHLCGANGGLRVLIYCGLA